MTSLQKRTAETPGARSFPSSLCLWELLQMLRLRAEALAEHLEAPTGLGRMGDCGLKPSLSAWKPLRGLGVERRAARLKPAPPGSAGISPQAWARGRLARIRRLRAEALAERLEAPTGLGCRAPGSMSEPRTSWERGRPAPSLGARASPPAYGDCGLKPSLSAWKPLRGYGVERRAA